MTKSRNTRRALLISVLTMTLSFVMLIGTTFAWFTDTVSSGNNKIVAGNLDVEVTHTNNKVTNEALDKEGAKLFPVELWEPGVVSYETFTVKNAGSLAFNYVFDLTVLDFNTVMVEDKDTGKSLKDVIKLGVIDGSVEKMTREELVAAVKAVEAKEDSIEMNFTNFSDFGFEDSMKEANAEKTFTMVAYWEPTENDNDYNMNGDKTVSKLNNGKNELYIDIVVNVVATQAASESDSFDKNYDAGLSPEKKLNAILLTAKGYTAVNSLEELNSVEATKIFLNHDITTSTNWNITSASLTEIDLNGYSFNNKVVVNNGANVTITDSLGGGSISRVDVKSGTLTLDNCMLTKYMSVDGGAELIIKGGKCTTTLNTSAMQKTAPKITIEDGEFSGGEYDMFFLGTNSVLNINGGKFSGKSSFYSTIGEGADITINDGTFENLGIIGMGPNVKFTIEDGTFTNFGTFTLRRGNELTINGGTFTGLKISPLYSEVSQVTVTINGGTFDSEIPASYLGKDKVCVDNGDGTWTVVGLEYPEYTINGVTVKLTEESYNSIKYHDKAGYTDKVFSIELWNKVDLVSALTLINEGIICHNTTNDISPKLIFMADIDFGGDIFTGLIKNIDVEGNGHTLSNIKFVGDSEYGKAGFIPYAGNNKVNQLTIKDATVTGSQAGIFGGNAANAHLTGCALAGNITVIYADSAKEDYNGVGAVFGVISEGNCTIGVDVTKANITIILDGITYPGNFAAETDTNLVGVVYGGEYTISEN